MFLTIVSSYLVMFTQNTMYNDADDYEKGYSAPTVCI